MPVPAISVERLSKRYLVGHRAQRHRHGNYLREVVGREARNFLRKASDVLSGRQVVQGDFVDEFWALKDVSFDVNEGEILGIIGRNGAGKSTLLKILARITEPTAGRVTLRGRVASLLEVGTGFHPELSGRENIFLNGTILGMTRREIRRKFDEIVSFAEVEDFIDTPVKRYSSGMYVRLAFSVAAHLEPEILVVDEVLSVGDTEFQKKCLGKMNEISRVGGRTVLFVSHNLTVISELTNRTVLLDHGALIMQDDTAKVLSRYLSNRASDTSYVGADDDSYDRPRIARAEVVTSRPGGVQDGDAPLRIQVWIRHESPVSPVCVGIQIINQFQSAAAALHAYPPEFQLDTESEMTAVEFNIPVLRLNTGLYHLRIWLTKPNGEIFEKLDGVCGFEVIRFDREIVRNWPLDSCVYREQFSISKISGSKISSRKGPPRSLELTARR
jgi:lipopolysaccharide transport system ATP-binding protein